jgi:serine/threonine-protein kinase RsbW
MSPQRRFPNEATSVSAARRYALDAIHGLEPQLADAVAVMVSELAANAVRHSGTHFTVTIDRSAELIRIAVTDSGAGSPVVRTPEPIEPSGRGLQIVEALASDWGVVPNSDPPGKTVWFTVVADPERASQTRLARQSREPVPRRESGGDAGGAALSTRDRGAMPPNQARTNVTISRSMPAGHSRETIPCRLRRPRRFRRFRHPSDRQAAPAI